MAKLRLLSSFTIPPMQSDFKETLNTTQRNPTPY